MSRVEMAEQISQQLPATRNLHESLSRAEDFATRRKHSVVGLDHLLLALGQDPEAVNILVACNVDVEALCLDLLRKLGPEARMLSPNTVPPTFDVTVQNLIAHASAAAMQAGYTEIDGSNILSAIISGEGGMITHKILQRHGLTFNETVKNLTTIKKPATNNQPKEEEEQSKQPPPTTEEEKTKTQNSDLDLNRGLKQDELLKSAGPDITDDILDDTIVQAEAHPSDYGISDDDSEDFPIPPNRIPPNRENQHQTPDHQRNPERHVGENNRAGNNNRGIDNQRARDNQREQEPLPTLLKKANQPQTPPTDPSIRGDKPQSPPPANLNPNNPPAIKERQKVSFQNSSFNPEPFNRPPSTEGKHDGAPAAPPQPPKEVEIPFGRKKDQSQNSLKPPIPNAHKPEAMRPPIGPQAGLQGAQSPQVQFGQQGPEALQNLKHQNPTPQNLASQNPGSQNLKQRPPGRALMDGQGGHSGQNVQGGQPPPPSSPPLNHLQTGTPPEQPLAPAPPTRQIQGDAAYGQQPPHQMDDLASSMRQAQANIENASQNDQVLENIPKVMRVGKVHFVEVRVARFANTELDFGPENYGLRSKADAGPITKAITVRLTGPDGQFLIDCATSSTQWSEIHSRVVDDVDFVIWRWRVMPRKKGTSKLRLDITCRTSNEDGLSAEIPIQPSKSIAIKITRNYLAALKKLLMVGFIFAAGYGIALYGEKAYEMAKTKIEALKQDDN